MNTSATNSVVSQNYPSKEKIRSYRRRFSKTVPNSKYTMLGRQRQILIDCSYPSLICVKISSENCSYYIQGLSLTSQIMKSLKMRTLLMSNEHLEAIFIRPSHKLRLDGMRIAICQTELLVISRSACPMHYTKTKITSMV